jgi:hypothetical protein
MLPAFAEGATALPAVVGVSKVVRPGGKGFLLAAVRRASSCKVGFHHLGLKETWSQSSVAHTGHIKWVWRVADHAAGGTWRADVVCRMHARSRSTAVPVTVAHATGQGPLVAGTGIAAASTAAPAGADAKAAQTAGVTANSGSGPAFCGKYPKGYNLSASLDNVYACGPAGKGTFAVPPFEISDWGFQCVEYANRFLSIEFGMKLISGDTLGGAISWSGTTRRTQTSR